MLTFVIAGIAIGALYALSGVGLVLLYRATGVLNLAYGAIGATGVLIAWETHQHYGLDYYASLVLCLLVTTGLSLVWGAVVGPWLAERDAVVKATASLGLAMALLGICNWYWNDKARTIALPTDDYGFTVSGITVATTQVAALALALLVTAAAGRLLVVTRVGTLMRALADDRHLSATLGVRVRAIEALAWGISGLLAGISALPLADLTVLSANNLTFLVIPAMSAALIGRLQSLWGTLAGGISVGVLEALLTPVASLSAFRSTTPFVVAVGITVWAARHKTYTIRTSA